MDELRDQNWTIDKRISLGHVYSFGAAMVLSLGWLFGLQYQINNNKDTIRDKFAMVDKQLDQIRVDHMRDMARLENIDSIQYAEIIRRLELLQAQMNEIRKGK